MQGEDRSAWSGQREDLTSPYPLKGRANLENHISGTAHVGWAPTYSECSTLLIPFLSRSHPPATSRLQLLFNYYINLYLYFGILVRWVGGFGGLILGFKRGRIWPKYDFPLT